MQDQHHNNIDRSQQQNMHTNQGFPTNSPMPMQPATSKKTLSAAAIASLIVLCCTPFFIFAGIMILWIAAVGFGFWMDDVAGAMGAWISPLLIFIMAAILWLVSFGLIKLCLHFINKGKK